MMNDKSAKETADRRHAEKGHSRDDELFRSLFYATCEGILIHDQGRVIDANHAAAGMLGYSGISEIIGKRLLDFVAPESRSMLKEWMAKLTGEPPGALDSLELVGRRKDGTTIDLELLAKSFTWHGRPMRAAAVRDITARKQAETALRYRMKFEALITTISTHFINLGIEEIDNGINAALRKISEFTGDDRAFILLLSEDGRTMSHSYEWCAPGIVPFKDRIQHVPVEHFPWWMSKLNHFEHIHVPRIVELPDKASTERELMLSLGAKSGIVVPMVYQRSLIGGLGINAMRKEKSWSDDVITLLRIVGEIFANALERKRTQAALHRINEELERKVEERTRELREKQALLVQSEKMAALGLLVAGIAHEINTPLGAMKSNNDTCIRSIERLRGILMDPSTPEAVREHEQIRRLITSIQQLNEVSRTAADRITSIVNSLRNFARLDQAEVGKVDLHEGLESTLTLVHHEIKNRIEVRRQYGDLPLVGCHPNQINQVFMNILVNAIQAIDGPGTIVIRTFTRDGRAVVEFTDSGKGITEAERSYIFDPGFTTKGSGIGTGLGLSIVHQIITDHNGDIEVESEPGRGTTFRIILPTQ